MKMLRWLILLTLFVHNSLAFSLYDEIDDYNLWQRDEPSSEETKHEDTKPECKKDILVLWDNSNSIGRKYFPKVKEFLKKLINNKTLNVREKGTRLGFITFSTKDQTRELLKVGAKTEPGELTEWLDEFDYDLDLSGVDTYTGKALKLANDVFKEPSPRNFRRNVGDVILLFTDGKPEPEYPGSTIPYRIAKDQRKIADRYSKILKEDKNVTIIGLAGGNPERVQAFKPYIERWSSSPDLVFAAKLDELDKVVDKLVDASCRPTINPAEVCKCDGDISTDPQYIKPGENKLLFKWIEPKLTCDPHVDPQKTVDPADAKSNGQEYGIGLHKITYTFSYNDSNKKLVKHDCVVSVDVAGACECPSTQTVNAQVKPGHTQASVSWSEPTPTCPTTSSSNNPKSTTESFSVGKYTRTYKYTHKTNLHSFDIQCHVNIVVTGKYCGGTAYNSATHVCCCGQAHPKRFGYECCGKEYYNPRRNICCQDTSLVSLEGHCP